MTENSATDDTEFESIAAVHEIFSFDKTHERCTDHFATLLSAKILTFTHSLVSFKCTNG